MESGKLKVGDREVLIDLIKKYSGKRQIAPNADLEWKIGLTGDDAFELLAEYSQIFDIDISKFPFHKYFYNEGENIVLIVRKIFRVYRKEKFTLNHLLKGIVDGTL